MTKRTERQWTEAHRVEIELDGSGVMDDDCPLCRDVATRATAMPDAIRETIAIDLPASDDVIFVVVEAGTAYGIEGATLPLPRGCRVDDLRKMIRWHTPNDDAVYHVFRGDDSLPPRTRLRDGDVLWLEPVETPS